MPRFATMRSIRRMVAYVALALTVGASGTAAAEEEVRISLAHTRAAADVRGEDVRIFDALSGSRLYGWKGSAKVVFHAVGGNVVARAGRPLKGMARARRIVVESKGAIQVGSGLYFGRLELRADRGRLRVVNRLPLETYLLGIVGSEMNPNWPMESLKAQAVAARSYAMHRRMMMRAANKPYDLAATVLSQVYKGADRIRPSVVEAVRATRGEVLSYDHGLVEALFHSTCGGRTVSARSVFGSKVAYLKGRRCGYCRPSSRHRWNVSLSLDELSRRLRKADLVRGKVRRFTKTNGTARVVLDTGAGNKAVEPSKVRRAVGYSKIYSSRFTARTTGSRVHIEGRGFGHGVGMCQWGARGMADAKKGYREILEHYYAGAKLTRIY